MSQVRKLKEGEKVERKYKILFDGQEVYINDEQLNEISNGLANLNVRYKQYLGGVPSSIRSGDFRGDDIKNSMSESALTNLSERDLEFLREGKRTWGEAITNAATYQAKEAMHEGLRIIKNVINRKSNSSSNTSKTKIGTDKLQLDFNQDENGEYYLSPTANTNLKAKNRVNQILEHLKNGDASTYDVDGWDLSGIQSWINGLENNTDLEGNDKYEKAVKYFSNLWTNLDKNNRKALSPDDIDLLENFGIIGERNGSGDKEVSTTERDLKKDFAENPELYSVIGEKYVRGSDGVWRLKAGETPINWGQYGVNLNSGQGIYFGDSFYTDTEAGISGKLNPLRGLTFYGDTIYKLNDPRLKELLEIPETGYNAMMRSGNMAGAESIIKTDFRANPIELTRLPKDQYSPFLSDNIMFNNLTGVKDLISSPLTDGQQLIQYINLNDPEQSTSPYVNYRVKYAVLDENGDVVTLNGKPLSDISESDTRSTGSTEAKEFNTYNRVFKPNSPLNGYYYAKDGGIKDTNIRLYRDPNDSNNIVVHLPNLKGASVQNTAIKIPTEAAKIIFKDEESTANFVKNMSDPSHLSTFIDLMSMLTTTGFRYNFSHSKDEITRRLRYMGYSKEDADSIWNAVHAQKSEGKDVLNRIRTNTYSEVGIKKIGGKIDHVAKLLKGGSSYGTTKFGNKVIENKSTNVPILGNPAGFGEKWEAEDWEDFAALVLDIGSSVVTLADPTNVGGFATGAAASLARFAADKGRYENSKRNGDGKVSGKGAGWNLLLNLGMDALTLIPIAGDAAAVVKTTRNLRKHIPTLLKLVSLAGMGDAAYTTVNKLANNEKLTVRDWSVLANAVAAGATMYRVGGFGKNTTTGPKSYAPETVKIGKTKKELSSTAIERIVNSSDQRKQLEIELGRAFNKSSDDAAIVSKADEMLTKNRNIWAKIRGKDGKEVLDRSKSKPNPEEIQESDNQLYNFWHGVGEKRAAYLRTLRGEGAGTKRVPIKYAREDVVEALNTTPGAKYYTDKNGITYRRGTPIEIKNTSQFKPGRSNIYDNAGNLTGVNVQYASSKEVPIETWNNMYPNILMFDHANKIVYTPSTEEEEDVTSYQSGGNMRTIVRRNKKNGEYSENVYDGDVPDDKLILIEGLNNRPNLVANYANNGQISGYSLPDEEIVVTREEDPNMVYTPIYGSEGEIVGWYKPESVSETPVDVNVETPTETTNTPTDSSTEENVYAQPDQITIGFKKQKKTGTEDQDAKFKFFTENFGINNPTITSLEDAVLPVSKQKVKRFKTRNDEADMSALIDAIKQLSEKENVVVKGQDGLPGIPGVPNFILPSFIDQVKKKEENSPGLPGIPGVPNFILSSFIEQVKKKEEEKKEVNDPNGYNNNIPNISKMALPALSAFRYFNTLHNQRAYRDTDKKRIAAAGFDETATHANLARMDNPVIDRALRQINEERSFGVKPTTSNQIANAAIKMQRDAQLYDRENNLITNAADAYQQRALENLNISNLNISNATETGNKNRARRASINSMMYNPDLEYLLRRDASNQAATLEMQRNIRNDRAIMTSYMKRQQQQQLTDKYNSYIDDLFPGARADYENLSAEDSAKYYDFEDYLKRTRPDDWAKNKAEIERQKRGITDSMYDWLLDNSLSGYSPRWIYGRQSTVGVNRKGGRINGRTRYTLEPDERLWIENNRASHNQIAKLNNDTIKLLLKVLKNV